MKIHKERKKERKEGRKKLCDCSPLRPDCNTLAEIVGLILAACVSTKYSEVSLSHQSCQYGTNYRRFYVVSELIIEH